MQPKQVALLERALDLVLAECVRSPVATWHAAHLEALLVEHLLREGAAVLERANAPGEEKLLRMTDEVLRVERCSLDARHRLRPGRGRRAADIRVWEPVPFALDLYARSSAAAADRLASRALRERLLSLGDSSDALLLACDRRAWDALRIDRSEGEEQPPALARLCALMLPASATLGPERVALQQRVSGRVFHGAACISPMVFGVQRVVAALWPAQRGGEGTSVAPQLDAFEAALS